MMLKSGENEKINNDTFFNSNGDLKHTKFGLNKSSKYLDKKGIYFFYVNDELKYIGRCRDNFKKRINRGYGNISPKNCFLDDQSTNCRINNLINTYKDSITFYVLELESEEKIILLEKKLINELNSEWNL